MSENTRQMLFAAQAFILGLGILDWALTRGHYTHVLLRWLT